MLQEDEEASEFGPSGLAAWALRRHLSRTSEPLQVDWVFFMSLGWLLITVLLDW